jgi:hypothetical protein
MIPGQRKWRSKLNNKVSFVDEKEETVLSIEVCLLIARAK